MPREDRPGPSVKDKDTYEALRDKGYSKEKSARIANARAAGDEPSVKGGKAPPYEDWNLPQLKQRASEVGIEGRSAMRKQELINALRKH